MGFKEIEVGFPSASQPDFDFIRQLIEDDLIPDDVTIQVLTQCRPELIERTYECLQGVNARHRPLLQLDVGAPARVVLRPRQGRHHPDRRRRRPPVPQARGRRCPGRTIRYEYSPESFTGTEADYAVEICEAVMDVIEPTLEDPLILNLPATVEMFTPNLYADVIEWFHRTVRDRDKVVPEPPPPQRPGHRASPPPSSGSWPAPTGSRARCSATASAPATSTSSTSP